MPFRPLRSLRLLLAALAIAAPLALSACSSQSSTSSNFSGAKKDAEDVITKLGNLADDRNSASICKDLLTPALAAAIAKRESGDCTKGVDQAVRNADYTAMGVKEIKLNGDDTTATTAEATIQVQKDGPRRGITLQRTDAKSSWRIASLQPTLPKDDATTPASTTPASTTP